MPTQGEKWLNCFVECCRMSTLGVSWCSMMPPVCGLQQKTIGSCFDTSCVLPSRAPLSLLEQISVWSSVRCPSYETTLSPLPSSRNGHLSVLVLYSAQQDSFVLSLRSANGWWASGCSVVMWRCPSPSEEKTTVIMAHFTLLRSLYQPTIVSYIVCLMFGLTRNLH